MSGTHPPRTTAPHPPRAVVLGAGALGSVYAAALARAGCDTTVLARPAHVEAIEAHGLVVASAGDEEVVRLAAVADPDALPAMCDLAVVAAKAADVPAMLDAVATTPRTAISIQNGVAKDEPLVAAFGGQAVVGCVSMVGATLLGPGRVAHTMAGTTYLGGGAPGAADRVAELLRAGGLPAERRDDIAAVVWSKAVLAVAAMGAVALTRLRYHRVFLDQSAAALFLDLATETAAVAAAEGVGLVDLPGPLQMATLTSVGRDEAMAVMRGVGDELVAAGQVDIRVSVLQSIESGRRTEVEAVFGAVLDRAARHGVEVPVVRTVTRALRAIDATREP